MEFELLPEQLRFINSKQPIVFYGGGIGAGKSYVACVKAAMNAIKGRTQLMVGLTYSAARDVLLDTLSKVLYTMGMIENNHYVINKSNLDVTFSNGTKILIRSAEIGNKLRGLNVGDIFIDEFAYLKDDSVFNILLGRLREQEDGQIYLTSSPRGFNFAYDIAQQDNCDYIKVSTFKNSFLADQYIKNMLKQYSTTFIRQELYADFVTLSNGFFKSEWIRDLVTNEQLMKSNIGSNKKISIRFWDFAFSANKEADYSAGVLLSLVDGRYIIEDIIRVKQEYVDLRKTIIETAKQDGTDVVIGFEKAGQQKSVISDLSTIPELSMFRKKTLVVSKYGSKMKRILPVSSQAEMGNIYIVNTCRNKKELFDEINQLTMDDSHTNDDMVDSLASAYILLNEGMNTTTGHKTNIY